MRSTVLGRKILCASTNLRFSDGKHTKMDRSSAKMVIKNSTMKLFYSVSALFLVLVGSTKAVPSCPELVWSDEFDGTSLDSSKWTFQYDDGCQFGDAWCGWGEGEQQLYKKSNVEVSNGSLKITANKTDDEITSGRILTKFKATFDLSQPRRIEARIKFSGGKGIFPQFRLLPPDGDESSGVWPQGGELSVMEYTGREPNNVSMIVCLCLVCSFRPLYLLFQTHIVSCSHSV